MPTVTDANLLLGRLDPDSFLGGGVTLHRDRTEQLMHERKGSLTTVQEFAAGILSVVETQMEKAIRVISIERGHDPREFTLVAFGGAGPLHACSLARALRIPRCWFPPCRGAVGAWHSAGGCGSGFLATVMLPGDAINSLGRASRKWTGAALPSLQRRALKARRSAPAPLTCGIGARV